MTYSTTDVTLSALANGRAQTPTLVSLRELSFAKYVATSLVVTADLTSSTLNGKLDLAGNTTATADRALLPIAGSSALLGIYVWSGIAWALDPAFTVIEGAKVDVIRGTSGATQWQQTAVSGTPVFTRVTTGGSVTPTYTDTGTLVHGTGETTIRTIALAASSNTTIRVEVDAHGSGGIVARGTYQAEFQRIGSTSAALLQQAWIGTVAFSNGTTVGDNPISPEIVLSGNNALVSLTKHSTTDIVYSLKEYVSASDTSADPAPVDPLIALEAAVSALGVSKSLSLWNRIDANTTPSTPTDGTLLSAWGDYSYAGRITGTYPLRNWSQGTAGAQSTYHVGVDAVPYLQSADANRYYTLSGTPTAATSFTLVFTVSAIPTTSRTEALWASVISGQLLLLFPCGAGGAAGTHFYYLDAAALRDLGAVPSDGLRHTVALALPAGGTGTIYIDGTSVGTFTNTSQARGAPELLMNNGAHTQGSTSKISEFMIFEQVLTAGDIHNTIQAWTHAKWKAPAAV